MSVTMSDARAAIKICAYCDEAIYDTDPTYTEYKLPVSDIVYRFCCPEHLNEFWEEGLDFD